MGAYMILASDLKMNVLVCIREVQRNERKSPHHVKTVRSLFCKTDITVEDSWKAMDKARNINKIDLSSVSEIHD